MAFLKDLKFITGALESGLDPMAGISMYDDARARRQAAIQAKREAAIAQQQMAMEQQMGMMGMFQDAAIEGAQSGLPQDALAAQLQSISQFQGGNVAGGLSALYPSGAAMSPIAQVESDWDDEDTANVARQAYTAMQSGVDRASAREKIRASLQAALGPAYAQVDPQVDDVIDRIYAGEPIASFMSM